MAVFAKILSSETQQLLATASRLLQIIQKIFIATVLMRILLRQLARTVIVVELTGMTHSLSVTATMNQLMTLRMSFASASMRILLKQRAMSATVTE
jgi:hypothetical protein